MANKYYKECPKLEQCNALIEKYWNTQQYDKCFAGHMELAKKGYPLAECQIGCFYLKGLGVEKDLSQAFYWTKRAAEHGDWDGEYNLASFYEEGLGTQQDLEKAKMWYKRAAEQGHSLAITKCKESKIDF